MKKIFFLIAVALLIAGCEEAKEAGDETAREITGSNMIKQGKQVQQQLDSINRQQQQRLEQLDQQ